MSRDATVLINGKFLLADMEGMPRVARELCAGFDRLLGEPRYRWIDMRLVVPRGADPGPDWRHIRIERVGRLRGALWEQIEFPLHARGRYCVNFTNTAPLAKRNGCVVVHDAQFVTSRASHHLKSRLLYGTVTPLAARRYRTVVTVSPHAAGEIRDHGVCRRDDIRIIPNGVDHVLRRRRDDRVLARHGLERDGYALANSYVHAHKNVRTLFGALALPGVPCPLALFGSSKAADYAARGIPVPPGVVFLGRVSDEELVSLMANARMFLFPSSTEGFGLPPLEAMLLGCPTICAPAGAVPHNCAEGAWYADTFDAGAWRRQIDRLWTDDAARRALAAAGRARAGRFAWLDAARAYLDVIAADLRGGARQEATAPRPALTAAVSCP